MAVQGAILDIDGTLVLSNDLQAQAWVDAFNAYGYGITYEQVRPLIGMGGDHLVSQLVPALDGEAGNGKAIADRRKQLILDRYASNLAAANGARDLVLKMRDSGLKLVAATSATSDELDVLLRVAQVDDLLPEFTTSSDAEASKPSADLVEAALMKAQMSPTDMVMLGDTPYDIEAASKAGVKTIAFRCGGFSDQDLSGAIAIYDDPADLVAHYDRSPLAQSAESGFSKSAPQSASDYSASDYADSLVVAQSPTAQAFQKAGWILSQVFAFLEQFLQSVGQFLQANQRAFGGLALILGVLMAGKILLALLDALNDIPLLPVLIQWIGLAYIVWFISRYLVKASTRQELARILQNAKAEIFG